MNRRWRILLACGLFAWMQGVALADDDIARKETIKRDGKAKVRVVQTGWGGEYPDPVINVEVTPTGFREVHGYSSEQMQKPVTCNIKTGIYHPWSKMPSSMVKYFRITALNQVRITKPTKLEDYKLTPGELVDNIMPQSEGFCTGQIKVGKAVKEISFTCNELNPQHYKQLTPKDNFEEQWISIKCQNGQRLFILDKQLLKQPGVKPGKIIEFGKVGK